MKHITMTEIVMATETFIKNLINQFVGQQIQELVYTEANTILKIVLKVWYGNKYKNLHIAQMHILFEYYNAIYIYENTVILDPLSTM